MKLNTTKESRQRHREGLEHGDWDPNDYADVLDDCDALEAENERLRQQVKVAYAFEVEFRQAAVSFTAGLAALEPK